MKKIILIEDNKDISKEIIQYIEKFDYKIFAAETLESAQNKLKENFDIALLDIHLPDGSGIDILHLLKEKGIKTIITTVKNDENFIVKVLDMGADDYIIKPFSLAILRARIDLALRETLTISDNTVHYKNFTLDKTNSCIFMNSIQLPLTAKEFKLLAVFIQNPHRIFTRAYLLERFWDIEEQYINDNTLTVTIKRIREKIASDCISTIRGIGYKLD